MAAVAAAALLAPAQAGAAPSASLATRAPLPSDRLHFGLGNDPGSETWFDNSGVPWRYRYTYLAGGVNNANGTTDPCGANGGWQTWNSPAGAYATMYMQNSAAHNAIPVLTYYEINQSNPSAGNESAELTKISNTCLMQAYWADFTVLMQKAGAFGGTVVVHVEPDFWGFMEHQAADPTTLPAVVASSGNADLTGLPNTVAGMGLAFLKLRDKYAPNALLGIHASSWGSGVDIASDQRTTVDPNAEADKVAAFLNKAGIAGNPAGITPWDLVFNDVADHDAGYSGIWWDKTNAVFPNFTRWLAFMSRLHADTGLPLVEWQVPVGNQYFDTMNNTSGHYQDNRPEYFTAHPTQLFAAGIVAVLFGKANANQTNYTDDAGDGVTNPAPISTWQCNLCNNHTSTVSDDDGGFLRMAVGAYYSRTYPGTSCTLFPNDSVFNTDISNLPVNPMSATWTNNMTPTANLHPDLGTTAQQYGIPINLAPPPSTGLTPTFSTDSESDHPAEGYPIDQSTKIEGGPSAPTTSDRHALTIGANNCKLYEIYNLQNFTNGQTPAAGSGAVFDLSSNAMRPAGWTSADAAGLPMAPLLLRPDEVQAGSIAHAIRFTAHCTSTFIWPASHQAGSCSSSFPPMGARFRLRSSFNISSFSPATQTVLRAFQHYGLLLADNGSDWYFGGTTDDWWGTAAGMQMVAELKTIPASQFDAVDESGLQVAAGSYQAAANATPRCTTAGMSETPPSQQSVGGAVVVTASSTGCPNPRYEFWTQAPGGVWTVAQPYSTSATFNWSTTGLATGTWHLSVWVRDAASGASYDAFAPGAPYVLSGANACTSITASASPASPQAAGATVTITATASGCPNPRYEFWTRAPGGAWAVAQPYGTSASFTWSTGAPAGIWHYSVWARDATSSAAYDTYFPGAAYTLTATPCTGVTASLSPSPPQAAGTQVTITAGAAGCPNPRYEFWIQAPGGVWTIAQPYSGTAAFTWNTTAPAGTYRYSVWVRDAGSGGSYDAYFPGAPYALTTTPCTGVSASASPLSPQTAGTTVTITATASGCANPRYEFWILAPGGTWTVKQAYSSSATFTWNTTGLAPGAYKYSVWARDASSAATYDSYFPGTSYTLT